MLQQDKPDDYVIATGETRTVREFTEKAYAHAGFNIEWQGEGENEKGLCGKTGREMVVVDKAFFRPAEVELLLGSPAKAEAKLGWKRNVSFEELVSRMVEHDVRVGSRKL
jgi:GDPmannose 4,6-dehydratase